MTEKQNNSWVKIYRKIIDNPIYKSSAGIRVWLHCLLSATHTKYKIDFAGEEVELQEGEFVYGRYEWGKITRINPNTIENWINKLVKRNMLYTKRRVRGYGSILGISKWDEYQTQRAIKRANNERLVSDWRAVNINKNDKNNKEVLPNKVIRKPPAYGNPLINFVLKEFEERWGYPPTDKKPRFEAYNLLRKINGYIKACGKEPTDEYVRRAVIFLLDKIGDEDWAENVQTLGVIRRKMPMYLRPPKGGEER